jgi:uncharacterized OB-fold protein
MSRPLPHPTADTKTFWDGCAIGELRYQVCVHCGHVQFIPGSLCSACHQGDLAWKTSAGGGRILSHTTVHRAPTPAFRDEVPYVIALIDMDEGFRLMVNVKGGASPDVAIGQPVRIGFREVEGVKLPQAEVIA